MRGSRNIRPPRWPFQFLLHLAKESYQEEIEGDMEERFHDNIEKYTLSKARRLYVWDSLKLLRPALVRKLSGDLRVNHYGLLLNHFKFTFRLFAKNKFYTSLNIVGLTLGLTCGIVAMLYLQNEMTYDRHHDKHERIFRLTNRIQYPGADFNVASAAQELAPLIKLEFPEVLSYVRFLDFGEEESEVKVVYAPDGGERKQFFEDRLARSDSNVFSFFSHTFIVGDPKTCLVGPGKIVLTSSMAKKYFGDEPALGKVLTVEAVNKETFQVTAVIDDLPDNSHFKFNFLVSGIPNRGWVRYQGFGNTIWNPSAYTYLLFKKGYDVSEFTNKFELVFEKHFSSAAEKLGGTYTPFLEPFAQSHFYSNTDYDEPQGDISFVYTFTAVGLFVVLLVCINYVNLSTARSLTRAKEIGVRKVLGSTKMRLFFAVITEAYVLVFGAYLLAISCSYLLINSTGFNDLIDKKLEMDLIGNPLILFCSIGLMVLVGLLSGLYSGLFIPALPTLLALKGTYKSPLSGILFRRGLITLQFAISLLMIICTVLISNQLESMRNKELGFNKDNVLILRIPDGISRSKLQSAKAELSQFPRIAGVTYSQTILGTGAHSGRFGVEIDEEYVPLGVAQTFAGDDYLKTMNITLLEGRDFHKDSDADIMNSFIINQAFVEAMGWTDSPIGKKLRHLGFDKELGPVIGLVHDYNFSSLHNKIEPMVIRLFRKPYEDEPIGFFHLRLRGENLSETLSLLESRWNKIFPEQIFEVTFLDKRFDDQYKADRRQNGMFTVLSSISILIALLGLIGLALYSATQKTKEIGIRKVLGASIWNILILLSKEYLWLTILACVIAMPLSYLFIQEWLNSFAFRTLINWQHFVVPSILMLMLIFVIVSSQSMKVALSNPIDSLRDE